MTKVKISQVNYGYEFESLFFVKVVGSDDCVNNDEFKLQQKKIADYIKKITSFDNVIMFDDEESRFQKINDGDLVMMNDPYDATNALDNWVVVRDASVVFDDPRVLYY